MTNLREPKSSYPMHRLKHIDRHWLRPSAAGNPAIRLFCFPCAGGSPALYRNWASQLSPEVEVLAFHPPGRGPRIGETPCRNLASLVDSAETAIAPMIDRPYAFFGHSLGALLAFALTQRLRGHGAPLPEQLFVSAHPAPQVTQRSTLVHRLPNEELLECLRQYGGTPDGVLQDTELLNLLLPSIRADFEICETYEYFAQPPLPVPITAIGGNQDHVTRAELLAWKAQTRRAFSWYLLPGGHFYLQSAQQQLLGLIQSKLDATRTHQSGMKLRSAHRTSP